MAMPNVIPYKSFCWSLGTTSFRTKNFNKTIEEQLALLDEFWTLEENKGQSWSGNKELQTRYYDFMKTKGFVEGEAGNKPKDAREKTSGLVDIGLIDDGRKLSDVGKALLKISTENDFSSDNQFQIDKDSFIYLKQLLKTYYNIDGRIVRPFLVLLHLLSKFDYLTLDEYTYLLPLCIGENETAEIISGISRLRSNATSIDQIIINRLIGMSNYKTALDYFLENEVIILSDLAVTGSISISSAEGDITFGTLAVGNALTLSAKNGDISGAVAGSYDDFSIHSEIKKGESNLPDNKDSGEKELNVSCNNGDVDIELVSD